jgi:hypothetical protein
MRWMEIARIRAACGVLPRKEVQLISLAFHCACTTLDEAARGAISSNDQRR